MASRHEDDEGCSMEDGTIVSECVRKEDWLDCGEWLFKNSQFYYQKPEVCVMVTSTIIDVLTGSSGWLTSSHFVAISHSDSSPKSTT